LRVERVIAEAVLLAGPAYFFLQLLMLMRYRHRWLLLSLVPLIFMLPLATLAGLAFAVGSPAWPLQLMLASPVAFIYLVGLAVVKASLSATGSR
jgi:hypothetical protein